MTVQVNGKKAKKVEFVMPTTPADVLRIKNAVKEASDSMAHIKGERENIKAIRDLLKEELGLPNAKFNEITKLYHKQNYSEVVAKDEEKVELYVKVFGDPEQTA